MVLDGPLGATALELLYAHLLFLSGTKVQVYDPQLGSQAHSMNRRGRIINLLDNEGGREQTELAPEAT